MIRSLKAYVIAAFTLRWKKLKKRWRELKKELTALK
jgi:hypothetical protein